MTNDEIRLKIADMKGIEYEALTFVVGNEYVYKDEEKDQFVPIPDWPVSIADAWELFEEFPEPKEISKDDKGYFVGCGYGKNEVFEHAELSDTAPRAISLAYISWREAQG